MLLKTLYFYNFLSLTEHFHIIACNLPKKILLEVGRDCNPYLQERRLNFRKSDLLSISPVVCRVRTQRRVFSFQVCAFSITAQRCDYSAQLCTDLFYFLFHSLVQMIVRKRGILELELVGELHLGSTGYRKSES